MTEWVPTTVVRGTGPVSGINYRTIYIKGSEKKSPKSKLENTGRDICLCVEAASLSSKRGFGTMEPDRGPNDTQLAPLGIS